MLKGAGISLRGGVGIVAAVAAAVLATTFPSPKARALSLEPAEVIPSSIRVRIEHDGNVRLPGGSGNIAEPVAIDGDLYVVDKGARTISIARSGGSVAVLDEGSLPPGVTPRGGAAIVNMAGTTEKVFVGYHSETLPGGFGAPAALPDDARYRTASPRFDLIYSYDRAPDGSLGDPAPVAAFEATTNGHRGGGMLVLPDGRLLYARGDNLNMNYDGLQAPQDAETTVGKLMIVDPASGEVEIAARGLRNVQRMTYADASRERILFSDIGWTVAEEINEISVTELTDGAEVENFGWGRNPDDELAREGGFYVSEGPEADAMALGAAPLGEAGFVQPFAQFGREDRDRFFAVSGPVLSDASFDEIGVLFGDIVGGELFATRAGADGIFNDVFSIGLLDVAGRPADLRSLLGISGRVDLRLFNFADGEAGLLSERTGDVFRLTEVAPVSLPAALPMLGGAVALLALAGRRARSAAPA